MNVREKAIAALEARIGHIFNDRELLERALTHPSVTEGARPTRHYERLEFLGDRVLGLLTAERLLALYPDEREGVLSPRLAALVNGQACARVARRIDLGPALRLSPGETKSGGRDKATILGDAIEALMAAVYIDGDLDTARAFFMDAWSEEFAAIGQSGALDPKTELQQWAQGRGLPLPGYQVLRRTGPDHAPEFVVEVTVQGFDPEQGRGRSRQAAEKSAALEMLLKREGPK
ncbi:MAG TPA: ribonuclease III [Brevundimonas sp.]|uniref:ribonuclease III n=1 Tax=Brevundimonas sp. TaxID=1871086 RepID=UPI002CE6F483|nr:ribonuclease III [Brevundimonas sp.]HRH19495.1 ribonuclease III [Brevundimonas sp.]